jgi:hypothetical protein
MYYSHTFVYKKGSENTAMFKYIQSDIPVLSAISRCPSCFSGHCCQATTWSDIPRRARVPPQWMEVVVKVSGTRTRSEHRYANNVSLNPFYRRIKHRKICSSATPRMYVGTPMYDYILPILSYSNPYVIGAKRYGYFEITHFKRVFPAQHINSILHTGKVQVPVRCCELREWSYMVRSTQ